MIDYRKENEQLKESAKLAADASFKLSEQVYNLKSENDKLKAEIKNNKSAYQVELGAYNMECGNLLEENENLYQALQEIKGIAETYLTDCQGFKCDAMEEILQKITKAGEE